MVRSLRDREIGMVLLRKYTIKQVKTKKAKSMTLSNLTLSVAQFSRFKKAMTQFVRVGLLIQQALRRKYPLNLQNYPIKKVPAVSPRKMKKFKKVVVVRLSQLRPM